MDLKSLESLSEGYDIEFKLADTKIPLSLYETYSAFANTSGGIIYLGIEEENDKASKAVGVENAKQKRKQLFDALLNKTKVSSCVCNEEDITILEVDGKDIIRIQVHEAPIKDKPVYLNSDPSQSYYRADSGDHLLSSEQIQSLLNDKSSDKFDQAPNRFGLTFEDLDQESVESFINEVVSSKKLRLGASIDPKTILMRTGAYTKDPKTDAYVLNNGAILFFGKTVDIISICPSLWLCFESSSEYGNRWKDRITSKDLEREGNIFQFYLTACEKAIADAPSPYYLRNDQDVGKATVIEMLREAFANSLGNLDLFDQTGLQIESSPKEITFSNAGTMLVPLERALLGGISRPRNPAIFSFFQAMGISDHGGYGIPFLFEAAKNLRFIPPSLTEDKEENRTSLRIHYREKRTDLTKEEEAILLALTNSKGFLTVLEIASLSGIARDKTRRTLESLLSMGLVETNGKTTKGKAYRITN